MSKGKKIAVSIIAVFVVLLVVTWVYYNFMGGKEDSTQQKPTTTQEQVARQEEKIEYTKADTTQAYVRDGKECVGYYVAVSPDATEDQLKQAFKEITEGDGYYLHTVYFCSDVSKADGTGFDVAMVEEESEGANPKVTKAA